MLEYIPHPEHVLYRAAKEVREICLPLEKFLNIKEFSYEKIYKNNLKIRLTNRPEWMSYYYQNKFHLIADYERPIEHLKAGYYFTATMNCQEIFRARREIFNIGDGILFIDHFGDYCELYWFSSDGRNHRAIDFYLNNIHLLRMFIPFFKEKSENILSIAEKEKIAIFPGSIPQKKILFDSNINQKKFLSAIQTKYYHLHNGISLTEQEFNCAINLVEGKTAQKIAEDLSLSKRTIEGYTDRLKRKLLCASKSELIHTLLKARIDLYLSK